MNSMLDHENLQLYIYLPFKLYESLHSSDEPYGKVYLKASKEDLAVIKEEIGIDMRLLTHCVTVRPDQVS